jgi:hypothetical protein
VHYIESKAAGSLFQTLSGGRFYYADIITKKGNGMSSAIAILEKLLEDDTVTFKEHLLETASRHVDNAQQRFENTFDGIVRDISTIWGAPEFNSHIRKEPNQMPDPEPPPADSQDSTQEKKPKKPLSTVVPSWCQGTARSGGTPKALRMAHWKKPDGLVYIVLRTEIDAKKDIPLYYDLILGARRRKQEVGQHTENLRHQKENWMQHVVTAFNWLLGR